MNSHSQKNINKKFELRIFYLDGTFYPRAIFSSKNKQIRTDFRNYNLFNPNRCVPYDLPQGIKEKLTALMADVKSYLLLHRYDQGCERKIHFPGDKSGRAIRDGFPAMQLLSEKEVAEFLIRQKQYA